jgi:hypothetical protein
MPKYVHDQRTGAGYGYIGRKGFQSEPVKAGNSFPYDGPDTEYRDDEDLDDEDLDLRALINNKLSYNNLGRAPSDRRTDHFTMAKNRLDLSESETPGTSLVGLVPFPMRHFDGPAVGGMSDNPSYTVAPGRIDGSPYGWTRGVMTKRDDGPPAPSRFLDAIDPEIRDRVQKKLKIARLK